MLAQGGQHKMSRIAGCNEDINGVIGVLNQSGLGRIALLVRCPKIVLDAEIFSLAGAYNREITPTG
jgi:hypothetical protein